MSISINDVELELDELEDLRCFILDALDRGVPSDGIPRQLLLAAEVAIGSPRMAGWVIRDGAHQPIDVVYYAQGCDADYVSRAESLPYGYSVTRACR